jgi:hypothetical protein
VTRSEAKAKADTICRYLSAENPEQVVVSDDGEMIAIVFAIIPDAEWPWLRAVECDASTANPQVVETLLISWKMQVLGQIANDDPSPVVRAAISKHGYDRVLKALKPRQVH